MSTYSRVSIRRATPADAASIVAIWHAILAGEHYSAVDRPFTLEQERAYIQAMSEREAVFLAETENQVVGFQTLDLWARYLPSMDHVGQLGTFVLPESRRRGVGHQLAQHTFTFARFVENRDLCSSEKYERTAILL